MIVVGADVHKRTHTFVVVDEVGRELGHKTFDATTEGHWAAVMWVRDRFGAESSDLLWAIEDCRHLSARLERDLLTAGQSVVRVPPKMMAEQRRTARTRGKSDPIDALAVARAAQREPDLPVATHDEVSRELKLRVDRRDDLVKQRTATINRLLWRVHELDPAMTPPARSMHLNKHQKVLAEWLQTQPGVVAEIARQELVEVIELTTKINAEKKTITALVAKVAPTLLTLPGAGALSAAKIVGEAAGVTRFKSEAAFARHAGIAPIPVWSGNTNGRVRLTRSGNRQLNTAVHRIALTQIRLEGPGQTYYEKKRAEGMSTTESQRCLKRRLARTIYNHLNTDQAGPATGPAAVA